MTAGLAEVNEMLKSMIFDQEAKVRVVVETGYDEAGLVATTDGYLRLAQTLVDFLLQSEAQETQVWDIYDKHLPGSTTIRHTFAAGDEIVLDTTMLAQTQEEANEVAEAFLGGMPLGASRSDARLAKMSQEEREIMAQEYERAAEQWIETRGKLIRGYNREWAKFLRGQTD